MSVFTDVSLRTKWKAFVTQLNFKTSKRLHYVIFLVIYKMAPCVKLKLKATYLHFKCKTVVYTPNTINAVNNFMQIQINIRISATNKHWMCVLRDAAM